MTKSNNKQVPFGTMIEEIAHEQVKKKTVNGSSKRATAATPQQVRNDVSHPSLNQALRAAQAELEKLKLEEFQLKLNLRSRWSSFLMVMVLLMIVFQMGLFVSVGLGWLTFGDEWIARLVLPGTFAQVLGFVYIIIRYLFPTAEDSTSKKAQSSDQKN